MRRRRRKRLLASCALVLLVVLGGGALLRWWSGRGPQQHVQASPQQIERGRYLAAAADCASCHTAAGGAPFAGGVPLVSPVGTIHGTNITPDAETGIGRYTADDFHHALTRGEARDGHQLYPAMPYVSYRSITREDADAIYAYLMSLPAVKQDPPRNRVHFPFNVRSGIAVWNLFFAQADPLPSASTGASPDWQRGRYLVDTLGHCGECHTPRGWATQLDRQRPLAGNNQLGRFASPDLAPAALAARGWDAAQLRDYLRTGISAHAVASDEMLTVVNLSTSKLTPQDLDAVIQYLLGDQPPAPQAVPAVASIDDSPARQTYLTLCSGCHGPDGEGVPHVAPAMRGNTSLRDRDPHNTVVAVLDGLPVHDFVGSERMQAMPGFADDLDDAQVAALSTWLRTRFGGQRDVVDARTVSKLRREARH